MIPSQFDEQFLAWFRKKTEKSWRKNEHKLYNADWETIGWTAGRHWVGGLSDQEINEIEQHWQLQFPPDYRLFLKTLHAMNKKAKLCTYFNGEPMEIKESNASTYLNWQTHQKEIEERYESIIDGMLFDVYHGIWWSGWGEKPATEEEQETRVRKLVAAAPRLIPVISNCYLLIEPCQSGNPILSIQQTDIIVYSPDLYSFFLREIERPDRRGPKKVIRALEKRREIWRERLPQYRTIPFWGEFV